MNRSFARRRILVALVAAATGCGGYGGTTPHQPPPTDHPTVRPAASAASTVADELWTSSGSDPALLKLGAAQLAASGTVAAGTTVTTSSASLLTLNTIAFDDAGTMWVASHNDSLLLGFAADDRLPATKGTIPTHVVTPVNRSLAAPTGLAFDRQHRLWVANYEAGTIVRYEPAQLSAGGPQVPRVTLREVGHPTALAFDSAGALWVSDNDAHRITKYGPGRLAASGAPTADVTIDSVAGSLNIPAGIAFDSGGRLWVANTRGRTIVAFAPDQLATGGAVSPAVVITPASTSLTLPTGLAFDAAGALWVVSGDGRLAKYDRAALVASGSPAASASLRVDAHVLFWSLAFWPKVKALPIS